MPIMLMQTTLAFAPTREDLEEVCFDAPVLTYVPQPQADPDGADTDEAAE